MVYPILRKAEKSLEGAKKINQNSEVVNFCGHNEIILFMLLAVLEHEDKEQVRLRKLKIVFSYLDILIAQEHWNRRELYWPLKKRQMLDIRDKIKKKDIPTLADKLTNEIIGERGNLFDERRSSLTPGERNREKIKKLLARMTHYVNINSNQKSNYQDYKKNQIEHIWGEQHYQHVKKIKELSELEFLELRNCIGGLILLDEKTYINQSLGGNLYEDKVEYYPTDNLLACSLHEKAYKHKPRFNRFISSSDLPFESYSHFGIAELKKRRWLYKRLAEKIWDPERLKLAAISEE